ncbi:MAG: DUF5671 domain-containing protein [Nitriliruptorales bacterium]
MPGLIVLRLLPVLVVVSIVIVVLVVRQRSDGTSGAEAGRSHHTLRQVFLYSSSLLGALLTASGLSGVLRVALETFGGRTLVSESERGLALGLSLTVVGLPVWVLSWQAAQRDVQRAFSERNSPARRLYLAALRGVTLTVAVPSAIRSGLWLVGAEPYEARAVAWLLVWGVLWAYHERVAAEVPFGSEHTRRIDRAEVYLAAMVGIALLAVALAGILARSLATLYDAAAGTQTLLAGHPLPFELRPPLVAGAVGAGLWWWHLLLVGRRDVASKAWFVYVFLVGVLSGTVTAVVSGSVLLHRLLAWVLQANHEAATIHFDVVPSALAGLTLGLALWGYHRALLGEFEPTSPGVWSGPERVYRYLVAAAGMLTAAGGIATVLMVGLDLAVPGRTLIQAPGGVRDVIAVGLTLLIIGVPLWSRFWYSIQQRVRDARSERTALARRVLIFGAFGGAIITTVVALSILLFELFDALLSGMLRADLIEEQRWSISLLLTAGAVSVHYALVLREDRAEAPEEAPALTLRELIVVAPQPGSLAVQLRRRLDVQVTAWRRPDIDASALGEGDLDEIVVRLRQVHTARALLIVGMGGEVELVPLFQE